ncbi:MAG: hypothetical protein LBN93_02340 [Candidatus Symbiothrix sp.]|jgi:hypothetical protein|nr:hypothetical protein [Candidatus Symbiothrix sp.]
MKAKRLTIAIHTLVWLLLLVIPYISTDQVSNSLDTASGADRFSQITNQSSLPV